MPRKRKPRKAKVQQPVSAMPEGLEPSVVWPGTNAKTYQKALSESEQGKGELLEALHRIRDWRLHMRAVKEQWPITQDMRERVAYEAMQCVMSREAATRDRLIAMRLVMAMGESNRHGDLPIQVTTPAPASGAIPVYQLIQELSRDPLVMDALDYRPVKNDDYAETSD